MTIQEEDAILVTSTTTGTGTYTVSGTAVLGYFPLSDITDGNTVRYFVQAVDANGNPTGDAERGEGVVGGGGTTLTRTAIRRSTNANAAVSWSAGTKRIAIVRPAKGTLVVAQQGGTPGNDELQFTYVSSVAGIANVENTTSNKLKLGAFAFLFTDRLFGTGYVQISTGIVQLNNGLFAVAPGDPTSTPCDISLYRAAAGVWAVGSGGFSGTGKVLASVLVEANTAGSGAPNVLTATESGTVFTNEGATAQNYHTLPTAVAGLVFDFVVQDSDGVRVGANTGDTIRDVATVSATAGFIQSTTVGGAIRLVAINATEWIVVSKQGTWTVDS